MKIFFSAIMLAAFAVSVPAQNRLQNAQNLAKTKNELILLNFSGSDWCIPCIKLHRNIISSPEFKTLETEEKLVYLNADFPRNKKNQPDAATRKENEWLADRYNPKGLFPYSVLMNADGKILKTWEGLPDETAAEFVGEIVAFKDLQKP